MSELETLPEGWELVSLQDVLLKIVGGGTPSKKILSYYQGNIPWFSVKDMKSVRPTDSLQHITKEAIAESATNLIPANTIVIATRIALGKAIKPTVDFTINQDLKAIFLPAGINSDFVLYWIIRNEKMIYDLGSGTTVKGITLETLNNLEFLLPPEKEQTRIVEKLEELLSDLDNGVAELKAAQIKLTQYRQSLLKSAVEGSLTAEWRSKNQPTETGQQLLQRILEERRQRWEQQKLAEFKEKGKKPPRDWQLKYPEPAQPDTSELPELPEGWVWASVAQLCEIQGGIQKQPKRTPKENKYPFLRVANVYRNELRLDEIHEIELFNDELDRLKLELDDILIVEGNGSKSEIGRCALWDCSIANAVHQNHLIRARPIGIVNAYLLHWLNSPSGMEKMSRLAATTSGLYTLSVSKISKIPVPICSFEEQRVVVDIIDSGFDDFDSQTAAIEIALKQNDAQRKNILKDAFSGKLVPQNPKDEPASVLLEKIKAERAVQAKLPKPKRAKKKPNTMKNFDLDALKKWIAEFDKEHFTFVDIEADVSADYENLKSLIFIALSEPKPVIYQSFDDGNKKMVFKKAGL